MKSQRNLKFSDVDKTKEKGYFDGAYQGTPNTCGVGDIIYLRDNNYLAFKVVAGKGTNNITQIYALWLLLKIVIERGLIIKRFQAHS
jgi:ribonuclease HI